VRASGSATVEAYDSATVRAYDSATVRASGSATVRASKYVAIHLFSGRATVAGGVLIDLTAIDRKDPQTWCEFSGVDIDEQGRALLYKAVDDNWQAGHGHIPTTYAPGTTVTATDWRDNHNCGGGLHFGATPHLARANAICEVTRFVAVRVPVASLRPIGDKCKAPACEVMHEVDEWQREIVAAVSA
jgi:hypothetical protein